PRTTASAATSPPISRPRRGRRWPARAARPAPACPSTPTARSTVPRPAARSGKSSTGKTPAERNEALHVGAPTSLREEKPMLKWAFVFLIVALIAGALGFTGVAGAAMGIAKFLFFLFLVLFIAFVALGATVFKKVSDKT